MWYSLFVEFRKRLGLENLNAINDRIVALKTKIETKQPKSDSDSNSGNSDNQTNEPLESTHKGRVIMDATAASPAFEQTVAKAMLETNERSIKEIALLL